MAFLKAQFLGLSSVFLIYMNDIQFASDKLSFYLFEDGTIMLYSAKNLTSLKRVVNLELYKVSDWITSKNIPPNSDYD